MTDLVVRTVPGDQLARQVGAYLHTLTEPCATSNEVVRPTESDLRP